MHPPEIDFSYAHGWIEILHRHDGLPGIDDLEELTRDQYVQVGSNIPLHEVCFALDIYEMYAEVVDSEFGIQRGFRAYDAFNLCFDEYHRIVTMVLVPRDKALALDWGTSLIEQIPSLPLVLIPRPGNLKSFFLTDQGPA